jgi:hypothetical protein
MPVWLQGPVEIELQKVIFTMNLVTPRRNVDVFYCTRMEFSQSVKRIFIKR